MKNIIVGTAGHIDHGKTALVGALTGIDTDRLAEEKRRGISIDLGFAHLELGGVRFGFVDVPGHERFVRNMLAGVGGIDMLMLVIGADESVMPQTREHFEICRLLGIRHGLVVLTKADLVDTDMLDLVRLEAAEFVAGSFLDGAPMLAVSSSTGEGLDALRAALLEVAARVEPRSLNGAFRLAVDRSFTLRGFGTVVTGTLSSGRLRVEDEVEVHPGGRRLRVRGLQVHSAAVVEALAGQRVAVNLAAVEAADLTRGMTLAPPGWFEPTTMVDCRFELLTSAAPLKQRAPVHFHSGTAATEAEVRLLDGSGAWPPGSGGFLRLLLKEPMLLLPGDRFIARMFSPVVTIGGGVVVDNHPQPQLRKSAALERLAALANGSLAARLGLYASETSQGATLAGLVRRSGLPPAEVLAAAPQAGLLELRDADQHLLPRQALDAATATLRAELERFHAANPLLPGMPRSAVALPAFLLDTLLAGAAGIVAENELLRLASHQPRLKAEEDEALAKIETLFGAAGLAVPAAAEVLAQSGVDAARARRLLELLLRGGRLQRVSADLILHADALAGLRELLARHRGERFTVAEFKQWTKVSRKYAIPLLEYLDRARLTRREGDLRTAV